MILSNVIHYTDTNSVEATWIGIDGVPVRCQSYADVQMDDLVADLGADAAAYAGLISTVRSGIVPAPPRPVEIPYSVTPFQARVALYQVGLLPQVEAIIADEATSAVTKLAWQYTTEFTRDSPTLSALAAMLGLTSAQVDDLFIAAYAVEV